MVAGLCLGEPLIAKFKAGQKLKVLVCGTGTGVLTMYIRQHFQACLESITSVEIDQETLTVAKNHFGFDPETLENVNSVQADAFEFVQGL